MTDTTQALLERLRDERYKGGAPIDLLDEVDAAIRTAERRIAELEALLREIRDSDAALRGNQRQRIDRALSPVAGSRS